MSQNYIFFSETNLYSLYLKNKHRLGLYETESTLLFQISKPDAGRKAYWIDGTIHAREWISTSTVLKLINQVMLYILHIYLLITNVNCAAKKWQRRL